MHVPGWILVGELVVMITHSKPLMGPQSEHSRGGNDDGFDELFLFFIK